MQADHGSPLKVQRDERDTQRLMGHACGERQPWGNEKEISGSVLLLHESVELWHTDPEPASDDAETLDRMPQVWMLCHGIELVGRGPRDESQADIPDEWLEMGVGDDRHIVATVPER